MQVRTGSRSGSDRVLPLFQIRKPQSEIVLAPLLGKGGVAAASADGVVRLFLQSEIRNRLILW
jgi:hypothetical protein